MIVTFPTHYQIQITTPHGLFKSKYMRFESQKEYEDMKRSLIQTHDASYFNFENTEYGITVIPGHIIQQSIVELIYIGS